MAGWAGLTWWLACRTAFYFHYWSHGSSGKWIDLPTDNVYHGAVSLAFAAIVFCQIGNVFACRSNHHSFTTVNPFSNRLIWVVARAGLACIGGGQVGIACELLLLVVAVYSAPLNTVLGTAPIDFYPNILVR